MRHRSWVAHRARRDERGVILVMAVPGVLLAVVALALSVDIGRQVLEKRSDQSIADLAALDSARALATIPAPANPAAAAQLAAEKSAVRNGFDLTEPGHTLTTELGWVDPSRTFHLAGAANAVRVSVTSDMDYIFVPGSKSLTAVAVADIVLGLVTTTVPTTAVTTTTIPTTPVPMAGFTLGSTLASIDTTKAPLLNAVLGQMLRGAASGGGTVNLLSWQGLVSSDLTLEALRGQLELLDAGVQFGTVDQLLNADITLAKLATATAAALNAQGDTNAALYAGPLGIAAQSTNPATFKLGDMFEVASGAGNAALATEFNAFQLLTGSAMLATGSNFVSVPNIGIALPGVGTTGLSLKVIEGQKIYIGPAGGSVSTGQIELTLTSALDIPISVAGLVGARISGSLPVRLTAAGATGTLNSITCPAAAVPGAISVTGDLSAAAASVTTSLNVSANVLGIPLNVFSVSTTGTAGTNPPPSNLTFTYPGQFSPTATGQHIGSTPLGLAGLTSFTATATVLGILPVPAGLVPAVTSALGTVVGTLDTSVLSPLLSTLGVSVGAADVSALAGALVAGCAAPAVPTPTTTTTTTSAPTTTSSTLLPKPRLVS